MILECAQLLSTAHWVLNDPQNIAKYLYKPTHKNHPAAVWVREDHRHYRWTYELFVALCREFEFRRGKKHKTEIKLLHWLWKSPLPPYVTDKPMKEPPQCMPPKCKIENDSVSAYRKYYRKHKKKIAEWAWGRSRPDWWTDV